MRGRGSGRVGGTGIVHLRIAHVYPAHMNLYGDRGNVLALTRRAEWRGWTVEVVEVNPGQSVDLAAIDLLFMGGGEDAHQALIAEDFVRRGADVRAALADGLPALAVCGAFQLLGVSYETAQGTVLAGVEWFDMVTHAGPDRAIGDVVVETSLDVTPRTLVGFENHGGRTWLSAGETPLGRVVAGRGNNGQDGTEGAVRQRTIGTYLHGSLLPKNPQLTDWLLRQAQAHRTGSEDLEPLEADWELAAHDAMVERTRRGRHG